MDSWKNNMPKGMLLKSYPWASNLSDVESRFTVKQFCVDRGDFYDDCFMPLPLETFVSYGEAFQARFTPFVERKRLVSLEAAESGLCARFDDGEMVHARRVVLAVGLSAFKYMPSIASHLPSEVVSHSGDYGPLDSLEGKNVAVVGCGSSATDLSALLRETGISVSLVARTLNLNFASPPRWRSLAARAVAPTSGIGNGWTMGVCAHAPQLVRLLPGNLRVRLANTRALGPLGGAFMKDRVIGKIPLRLGCRFDGVDLRNGKIDMHLTAADGTKDILRVDHVVFATGYNTDVSRLRFLDPELVTRMRLIGKAPQLSSHYESSIPGLHFIGPASANSFGPACRFVFGARHPSRHLARYLPAVLGRRASPRILGEPVDSTVLQ